MSFADLEARANAAVMRRLSNARGSFGVGSDFPVVFDAAALAVLNGQVETVGPQCELADSDLGAKGQGDTITVRGTLYTITGVQPDGTGLTVLQLRKAT